MPGRWEHEMWSEGKFFRDIGSAVVDIRAFDSSSLYVCATEEVYIRPFIERFGGMVQTPDDQRERA